MLVALLVILVCVLSIIGLLYWLSHDNPHW